MLATLVAQVPAFHFRQKGQFLDIDDFVYFDRILEKNLFWIPVNRTYQCDQMARLFV